MTRTILTAMCAAVLLNGSPASAQESGRFGVVMGYPTSAGVLWRVSDRLAVRPEVDFTIESSSATSGGLGITNKTEGDFSGVGVGVSALFYTRPSGEALRVYVSPRFVHTRAHATSETDFDLPDLPPGIPTFENIIEITTNMYTISGSVGAEYALHDRLSLFGELGMSFSKQTSDSNTDRTTESHGVGVRSAIGVVLFFR